MGERRLGRKSEFYYSRPRRSAKARFDDEKRAVARQLSILLRFVRAFVARAIQSVRGLH